MSCSDNACKRSTTCGAVDHTRTTDDWSPARSSVIRVARSSLACPSQAKNTPPMMLVQASKRFSAPSRRPENRIFTPNAPRSARGPLADERGVWPGRGGAARSAVASLFSEQRTALKLQSPRQRSQPEVMLMQVYDIFLPLGKAKKLHFDAKCAEIRAGAPKLMDAGTVGARGAAHSAVALFSGRGACAPPAVVPSTLSALRGVLRVASPSAPVVARVSSRRERPRLAAVSPDMSMRHRRPHS
ncbi:hypothetical protein EV715DRAFT_287523 [Schizophyllum commune]